jgi:adenylyltransferase/sulfurtransferase
VNLLGGRSALVLGAGGLGGPALVALAAAGLGRLTLLDHDAIDATNLGRQLLFGEADVGRRKARVAAEALQARFPAVRVDGRIGRFARDAASRELVAAHDVVLDGTDNFPTRFAANDLCCELGRPLVHGAALQWLGQLLVVVPRVTPCLRCLFEGEPPGRAPTCAEAGVVTPLVGIVGTWMAHAALALLAGEPPRPELRTLDAATGRERRIPVGRDPDCPSCAAKPAPKLTL